MIATISSALRASSAPILAKAVTPPSSPSSRAWASRMKPSPAKMPTTTPVKP